MAKRFRRSKTDQQLAGVCAGIADYTGADVQMVRIGTVLLAFFTSAPVLLAYVAAWIFVPEGESADGKPELEVDWQADGMRLSWKGPTAPYSYDWTSWAGLGATGLALFASAAAVIAFAAPLFGFGLGHIEAVVLAASGLMWPAIIAFVGAALFPQPYAVTLTHSALWIERPLRAAERIDPGAIETVNRDSSGLHLLMKTGERYRLPPPPPDVLLDDFLRELEGTRRRVLGHQEDLEAGAEERARLQRVMARNPSESQ